MTAQTQPRPTTYYYLKKDLYYERIEGGDGMPPRLFLNNAVQLACDFVLATPDKVLTGLRKCSVGDGIFTGDTSGPAGRKSFLWIRTGKDDETGETAFIMHVYPDWMPSDGCRFLREMKRAADKKREVARSLDALDVERGK